MTQNQPSPIALHGTHPPCPLPADHVGLVTLPGTSREVWWTGRVAIGLRFERERHLGGVSQSAEWVQRVLLGRRGAA